MITVPGRVTCVITRGGLEYTGNAERGTFRKVYFGGRTERQRECYGRRLPSSVVNAWGGVPQATFLAPNECENTNSNNEQTNKQHNQHIQHKQQPTQTTRTTQTTQKTQFTKKHALEGLLRGRCCYHHRHTLALRLRINTKAITGPQPRRCGNGTVRLTAQESLQTLGDTIWPFWFLGS